MMPICPFVHNDGKEYIVSSKSALTVHLNKWHHCRLVSDCGQDWAVSKDGRNKLLVRYKSRKLPIQLNSDASASASTAVKSDPDTLCGEHYICHTVCDRRLSVMC